MMVAEVDNNGKITTVSVVELVAGETFTGDTGSWQILAVGDDPEKLEAQSLRRTTPAPRSTDPRPRT